jgi:hypothetical protein
MLHALRLTLDARSYHCNLFPYHRHHTTQQGHCESAEGGRSNLITRIPNAAKIVSRLPRTFAKVRGRSKINKVCVQLDIHVLHDIIHCCLVGFAQKDVL